MLIFKKKMGENPILIIDDDEDDLELIKEAGAYLKIIPLVFFKSGTELKEYLKTAPKATF